MGEPRWLVEARTRLGVREIPGPKHSNVIMGWIRKLGARKLGIDVKDDETPWCGTFMASVMDDCGIAVPPIAVRASSWGLWGQATSLPRIGAVLVFTREGGGHVGLLVGHDAEAYHVLGGNQGNAVSITRIAKSRLSHMRWPPGVPLPPALNLPFTTLEGTLSRNEA
jgi:uncharacterized protein (TIGR02594 family)